MIETCPRYLLCSISDPPVVDNLATLKQFAKALLTNLTALASTRTLLAATATSFFLSFHSKDKRYRFNEDYYCLRKSTRNFDESR